jgi:hypothetical protein
VFPLAYYSNAKGSTLGIRPHLETAKFCPNSAVLFFCRVLACEDRRSTSASRAAAAAQPPALAHALRTRSGWHAALSLTPWRGHCNTHRSSLRLTLVAVFAQVRENVTAENGLAGPSQSPGALRHPSPPTFAAWPTPLMPLRRTSRTDLVAVASAGRCGRGAAERRDGRGFDDRGAPARPPAPARPRPARVAPCAAPHTAALSQLSSCAVHEQPYGSPSHQGGGTALQTLMASGATGACSGDGDSWATKPTAAQEQAKRRPGALPPAEAAPATTDPTTGRGTRRGRDEDVPPAVARDTSGLDGLPAPRDSKDASGNPYDNAASWVDDRVKKGKALQEQEQVTPSPYLPP